MNKELLEKLPKKDRPDEDLIDLAYKLFDRYVLEGKELKRVSKQIDFAPLSGGGFIIFLDRKLALWFFPAKDRIGFIYDGWEAGNYEEHFSMINTPKKMVAFKEFYKRIKSLNPKNE